MLGSDTKRLVFVVGSAYGVLESLPLKERTRSGSDVVSAPSLMSKCSGHRANPPPN